jgi:hypothetical protein
VFTPVLNADAPGQELKYEKGEKDNAVKVGRGSEEVRKCAE